MAANFLNFTSKGVRGKKKKKTTKKKAHQVTLEMEDQLWKQNIFGRHDGELLLMSFVVIICQNLYFPFFD